MVKIIASRSSSATVFRGLRCRQTGLQTGCRVCIIIVQFATLFLSNTDHGAPLAHSVGLFSAVAAETHCTAPRTTLTAEL